MHNFISNPDTLLKQVWNDSNINIIEKINLLNRIKFCLIDISLNLEGQQQEKTYLQSYFYRKNIRKGNTLIEIFNINGNNNNDKNKNKGKSKIQWGRKGLQKIIDIKLQYLESITQGISLNSKDSKRSFDFIFRNVNKHFQNGKRVQLLKTQKANGQNTQISYFYELDAWLISSNNVSLMASNINDLDMYENEKYLIAKQIAKQWLQEIKKLSKQKIKKLKSFLDGFTLVGQYCGNPLYQHIIQYNQVKIIWFALVDNFSQQICLDPFQVKKNIEQFGFKFVKIKRCGSFDEKRLFFKALQELYLKTAQSSIENLEYGMQGLVVYFVAPQMKAGQLNSKVLGAGKLKTIQFRFLQNIKEKMSILLNKKNNQKNLIKKYEQECILLINNNKRRAPYPIKYYLNLLQNGFNFIKTCKIQIQTLKSKFIQILKIVLYSMHKNIELSKYGQKLFQNQKLIKQITKISFQSFEALNCNQKIIFILISLPQIQKHKLINSLSQHFNRVNIPFNEVKAQNNQNQNQIISKSYLFNKININNSTSNDSSSPFLQYFYINQSLKCQQIIQLYNQIKQKSHQNVYHKFVLITDKNNLQKQFYQQNSNIYPFTNQSIIFSYYLVYKKYYNTLTIQQKILELLKVTKQIEKRRNFQQNNSLMKKFKTHFQIEFSKNVNIQKENLIECKKIIDKILAGVGDKQFQLYCKLILRLQKIDKNIQVNKMYALKQEQIKKETQNLIKNSFQKIPSLQNLF